MLSLTIFKPFYTVILECQILTSIFLVQKKEGVNHMSTNLLLQDGNSIHVYEIIAFVSKLMFLITYPNSYTSLSLKIKQAFYNQKVKNYENGTYHVLSLYTVVHTEYFI